MGSVNHRVMIGLAHINALRVAYHHADEGYRGRICLWCCMCVWYYLLSPYGMIRYLMLQSTPRRIPNERNSLARILFDVLTHRCCVNNKNVLLRTVTNIERERLVARFEWRMRCSNTIGMKVLENRTKIDRPDHVLPLDSSHLLYEQILIASWSRHFIVEKSRFSGDDRKYGTIDVELQRQYEIHQPNEKS